MCCHGEVPYFTSGKDHRDYTKPFGWARIMLNTYATRRNYDEWNVAYHGTAISNLESILLAGGLLKPGMCFKVRELQRSKLYWLQLHYNYIQKKSSDVR